MDLGVVPIVVMLVSKVLFAGHSDEEAEVRHPELAVIHALDVEGYVPFAAM